MRDLGARDTFLECGGWALSLRLWWRAPAEIWQVVDIRVRGDRAQAGSTGGLLRIFDFGLETLDVADVVGE
jgi:hypothetical protein